MPFQLKPRIEKTFGLEKADMKYGAEGTMITVKQATQKEHEARMDLYATLRSIYGGDNGVEMVQRWNLSELHRHEVRLTLIDCNILGEDDQPLFRFEKDSKGNSYMKMSETAFTDAWGKLPVDVTEEIHEKVLELNPLWGSRGE